MQGQNFIMKTEKVKKNNNFLKYYDDCKAQTKVNRGCAQRERHE